MKRAFPALSLLLACCSTVFAQSPTTPSAGSQPAPTAKFDVADVHVSEHSNNPSIRGGGDLRGGRYSTRQATMTNLIARAYGVESRNVLGGPPWLDLDRFDVVALSPPRTSPDDVRAMLRNLLSDRFKLVAHTDTKPLPAFALSVGKGAPKLKQADTSNPDPNPEPGKGPGCQFQPPPPNTPQTPNMEITFSCHAVTMESFAQFLHNVASPYLKNPVADQTGLKGAWDFDIHWSYQKAADGSPGTTIFDAVDKQLGLKLDAKTAPLPVIVVDSADETPTPNVPGIEKALPPPPPAAFDVAVIKPASPDEKGIQLQMKGSQIVINNAQLSFLITWSWDISDDRIANPPDYLNKEHWDILGKVAVDGPATGPGSAPPIDQEDLQQMLKTLLADRFEMKSHMEDRPADAYTLLAVNPHMKKADPLNRTGCKTGPGADGKDPRIDNPMLGRLVSCTNITMAQFADQLQTMASGYIKNQVVDETNVQGAYDFTLAFSTAGQLRAPTPAPADEASSTPGTAAATPTGGMSLFDALTKELGLKLEKRKGTRPMLVIDHLDEKPTDN
jgi:uncharacterized protein (TIGR03435 family)